MVNPREVFQDATIRRYARVAAFAVLGMSIGALTALSVIEIRERNAETIVTEEAPKSTYVLEGREPVRLSIPSIGLDTAFGDALGLNPDQTVEVPDSFEEVGWYKYGPTPGELGPAVVLGHVDSKAGPAVFYSLGQLEAGDAIEITREDGSVAVFEVTKLERYEQEGFPTALVYGDIDHAGLRLITCSGTYERGIQRYSHNLVVYAELIELPVL